MSLSDTLAKDAILPEGRAQLKLSDRDGLYLLVNKSGKYWRYDYRFEGKRKTLSIGVHPHMKLKPYFYKPTQEHIEGARSLLAGAKRLLKEGIDPAQHKKDVRREKAIESAEKKREEAEDSNTFEFIARKWFDLKKHGWSESHAKKLMGRLKNHVFPKIGNMPIAQVKKYDTTELIEDIVEKGLLETATKVYQITRCVFDYANDKDLIDSIPMASKKNLIPEYESEKLPAITDGKKLGVLLTKMYGYQGTFITTCALKLLGYLPIRQGEFRKAHWSEFDLKKATWTIPAKHRKLTKRQKNNPKNFLLMPLATQTVKVLKSLKKETGEGVHLFPNQQSGDSGFMSENTVNNAISRLGFKGKMTAHGMRATFSTLLNEQGFDSVTVDKQLGHTNKDKVEAVYNRAEYEKQRKEMMQHWADYADELRMSAVK